MFEILFCFLLYLKTEGYFPSQFQHKSIPEEVMECVLCVLEAVYTTMVEYDSCVGGYGMLVVDSISIYCKSRYLDRGATLWGLKILSLLVTQPKFFLEFNLCVPLTHKCENLMKLASLQDKIFYIEDAKISVQSAATNLLKSSISYFLENLRVCIAELTNFGKCLF